MQYTKLITEELFTAGRPLVIVLPLAKEDSINEEAGYLMYELHALNRWHILVFNTTYEVKRNMAIQIHKHGIYIILISRSCQK
jgi:hypothetical protein